MEIEYSITDKLLILISFTLMSTICWLLPDARGKVIDLMENI